MQNHATNTHLKEHIYMHTKIINNELCERQCLKVP